MDAGRLKTLVLAAPQQRILCLGDVMLDDYIYGTVDRISPEAPVPVLARTHSERMPGGAANTARNLAALGVRTRLVSRVGADEAGETLSALLTDIDGVDAHLSVDPDGVTTRKTRLVSGGQQLMRLDQDSVGEASGAGEEEMLAAIPQAIEGATAVLISDYAKGAVSADLIMTVLQAVQGTQIPVIVDPKGRDIARYGPVDLIKPNAAELSAMVEGPTGTDAEIEVALDIALELSAAGAVLVTRAARGLSYLERGGKVQHLRGIARDVYDVSGAGDTSLAAIGVALAAGASLDEAAKLALAASSVVVGKTGTAVVTPAELLMLGGPAASTLEETLGLIAGWREAEHVIGFTNGCFDILHPGHLRVLEEAKARCGRLVVGLNSDASVARLKGPGRPVNDELVRARQLAGLASVDAVVVFGEDTPLELIRALGPDLLVKGGDYTADKLIGAGLVQARGGRVHIVPLLEGHSTTALIEAAAGRGE